ncbi:MAG: hypothetical protein ACI83Y_002943, partial [Candidatus Azotimanducaceae bacterium]
SGPLRGISSVNEYSNRQAAEALAREVHNS